LVNLTGYCENSAAQANSWENYLNWQQAHELFVPITYLGAACYDLAWEKVGCYTVYLKCLNKTPNCCVCVCVCVGVCVGVCVCWCVCVGV